MRSDENQIKDLITRWADAVHDGDLNQVLADHANDWRRAWHNVGHANKWLEESLCETASLFALRAMGKRWETEPPFGNWKSYAPKLTEYAQKRLDDPKVQLPAGKGFIEWFRENEPQMRKAGTDREKNNVVARSYFHCWRPKPAAGKR